MSRECHMDDICQSELILAEGLRYGSFTLWKLIFLILKATKVQLFFMMILVSKLFKISGFPLL